MSQRATEIDQCRTSLVRVPQYAERIGLLHSCEGESNAFAAHQDRETLYENTSLCWYFSVNFHRNISSYTSLADFENPPVAPLRNPRMPAFS